MSGVDFTLGRPAMLRRALLAQAFPGIYILAHLVHNGDHNCIASARILVFTAWVSNIVPGCELIPQHSLNGWVSHGQRCNS